MTDDTGRRADDDEEPTAALGGGTGEHRFTVPGGGTGEHPFTGTGGGTGDQPFTALGGGTGEHRVAAVRGGTGEHRLVAAGGEPTVPVHAGDGDPPKGDETNSTSPDPSISSGSGKVEVDPDPGDGDPGGSGPSAGGSDKGDLDRPARRRPAPAGTLIWVLLALLGFTLVVQLRSNDADDGLSAARQEDLVRILSDLEAQDSRLLAEIQALEQSKQQLTSGVAGREAARAEAEQRSQELGLLAGTVPGRGPGLDITLRSVRASDVLNAVQELRGAGGEVMQLNGANGSAVRVVASSFFVDASGGGIIADGEQLTGPFHLLVIGPAETMSTALQIPGGVVASAKNDGGSVTMDSRSTVEVTVVRKAAALRYARPVS